MCNFLHDSSTPIKPTGIGYKIFRPSSDGLDSIMGDPYFKDSDGIIRWNPAKFFSVPSATIAGFCFFTHKGSAIRGYKAWRERAIYGEFTRLYKIRYFDGLGKHREFGFCRALNKPGFGHLMAICRGFKILEEVKL